MRALVEGRAEPTGKLRTHLDRCLTCFACETACPSGVEYRRLIGDARSWMGSRSRGSGGVLWKWFFRRVLPSARALRLSLAPVWLAQKAGLGGLIAAAARVLPLSWVGRALELVPDRVPSPLYPPLPEISPPCGKRRVRVGFQTGCAMEGMLPHLNRLCVAVLQELGCEVVVPRNQGCCGAMAHHAGERDLAHRLGRDLAAKFDASGVDLVVASAAGCGSTMREAGEDLAFAAGFSGKVRDFTEVVDELMAHTPPTRELAMRVGYQEACHLVHGQRITVQPRRILGAIPGVEVVELPEQNICCGSAGVYNLLQPELAGELKRRKAEHALAASVDAVVTANPGCLLQMRNALAGNPDAPAVYHLVEILAKGYGL